MNKGSKTLPYAIKIVVNKYGKDVVNDIRCVNTISDVVLLDETPAVKVILRSILKEGYGRRLLELGNNNEEWKLRIRSYSSEISNKYGYQQDIVAYILDSITYGLGWTEVIPIYNGKCPQYSGNRHQEHAISDLKGELANLKNEYRHLLDTLLVIPEKTSAYYPASALTQLRFIEGKIRLVYDALKMDYDDWCENEKEQILQNHYKDTSSLKRKSYTKVAAVAATALIGGGYGISYVSSLGDIETFNQTIQQGDAFMSSGLYSSALSSYKEAYTNYDAFNSSGYKDDAFQKMEEVSDKLIEAGKTDNESLASALTAIQLELQLNLSTSERKRVQEKLNTIETEISSRVENGKNTLVLNISANKGRLNKEGKSLLAELLKLSPKDYWLNFINDKEK